MHNYLLECFCFTSKERKCSVSFTEAEKRAHIPFLYHKLLECDHCGLEYTIEDHDVTLRIPPGAVSTGKKIYFEIGVAMYGPFIFPDNFQPISPILWCCIEEISTVYDPYCYNYGRPMATLYEAVKGSSTAYDDVEGSSTAYNDVEGSSTATVYDDVESYILSKPFQVVLPHFLTGLTQEKASLHNVAFAKANHLSLTDYSAESGQISYSFQRCEVKPQFASSCGRGFGILTTNHCCFFCLQANMLPDLDAGYCLARIESLISPQRSEVHFAAVYCLKSCLKVS